MNKEDKALFPCSGKVLLLDGECRTALAVVRSLGAKGVKVTVCSHSCAALAAASKYAYSRVLCPNPHLQPEKYKDWVSATVRSSCPDMLLPVTDLSLGLCLSREKELRKMCGLPFPSESECENAANKWNLLQLAQSLGLKIPQSVYLAPGDKAALEAAQAFSYPASIKAALSVSEQEGERIKLGTSYPSSYAQLEEIVGRQPQVGFLLQERIFGSGVGVFALCHQGRVLTHFCHRRILEKPPSGGESVLCESIPEDEAPLKEVAKLLSNLRWSGAVMVEFKRNSAGECFLMEINPRLWGSLQLAIDAGRDFPYLLAQYCQSLVDGRQLAFAEHCANLPPYKVGTRLRWTMGTLDHAYIRFKQNPLKFCYEACCRNALQLLSAPTLTRQEILRWEDPKPALCELWNWLRRK